MSEESKHPGAEMNDAALEQVAGGEAGKVYVFHCPVCGATKSIQFREDLGGILVPICDLCVLARRGTFDMVL